MLVTEAEQAEGRAAPGATAPTAHGTGHPGASYSPVFLNPHADIQDKASATEVNECLILPFVLPSKG